MPSTKLSCTIIALNEGDRIHRTLQSVAGIADEIIVVDSGSTDKTVLIAQQHGARVVHNDWSGYGPQKRFAEEQAAFDWILNLDADEVLTESLRFELLAWKEHPAHEYSGYRFHQTTVYPEKDKPRPYADFHNYVRLYDRRKMRFRDSLVHDTVDTERLPTGQFDGECWHWSWRSLEHLSRKLDGYTTLQAKEIKKSRWKLILRYPIEYPVLLFRYLFLKRHITGGLYGIKSAHVLARGRAARIGKFLAAGSGNTDRNSV